MPPFQSPVFLPCLLARDHHPHWICWWQCGSLGNGLAVPSAAGVYLGAICMASFLAGERQRGQAESLLKVACTSQFHGLGILNPSL